MSHCKKTIAFICTVCLGLSPIVVLADDNTESIEHSPVIEVNAIDTRTIINDITSYEDTYTTSEETTENENENKNDIIETEESIENIIKENKNMNVDLQDATKENYISKYVPSNNSFKSYMSYKAITSKSSPQYKLQQQAYTDEYGLRKIDDRYMIALGTFYTSVIGTKVDLVMANGSVIKCIIGDIKSNQHTCPDNIRARDGSIVEFIIDSKTLHKTAKQMGNISFVHDKFSGEIIEIKIY